MKDRKPFINLLKECVSASKNLWNAQRINSTMKSITSYQIGSRKRDPNTKISKKKTIHVGMNTLLAIAIIVCAIMLISCGDNDIINNNPPPNNHEPTNLIYSRDSFMVVSTGVNTFAIEDSVPINSSKIKVTFDIECNTDSSITTDLRISVSNDTLGWGFFANPVDTSLNGSYSFTVDAMPVGGEFNLNLYVEDEPVMYFIKVKDIKIYD